MRILPVGPAAVSVSAASPGGASKVSAPAAAPRTQAADLYEKLKPLASDLTLGFLGEDDGDQATAFTRRGPLSKDLNADDLLSALGYKDPAAEQQRDNFSFTKVKKTDKDFWDGFVSFEQNEDPNQSTASAEQAKKLLTSAHVKELATMCADNGKPFNQPCYLVAKMDDGSVVGLRGMVGGMGG